MDLARDWFETTAPLAATHMGCRQCCPSAADRHNRAVSDASLENARARLRVVEAERMASRAKTPAGRAQAGRAVADARRAHAAAEARYIQLSALRGVHQDQAEGSENDVLVGAAHVSDAVEVRREEGEA